MQLVQLIVLLIKSKMGVIQRGARVGKQRFAKELEVGERGTEVGSCGARVVFEVQRNHTKKKNIRENKNKFSKW